MGESSIGTSSPEKYNIIAHERAFLRCVNMRHVYSELFFPKGVKAPVAKNSRALPSRMLKALPCYYCIVIIIIIINWNIAIFSLFLFVFLSLLSFFVWHHSDQMYEWSLKSVFGVQKVEVIVEENNICDILLLFGIRSRWARVSKHNKLIFW